MELSTVIGNSYVKFALFDGERAVSRFSVSSKVARSSDEYKLMIRSFIGDHIANGDVEASVVCSVVPSVTDSVIRALADEIGNKPFVIGPGTRTGFKIKIYDPTELGADIVSNVAGAKALVPSPFVVMDFDTATTLAIVNADGDIEGVIIHPGLKLCLRALSSNTALLNDVPLDDRRKLIGQNSRESIVSGIINGHISMINGFIESIKDEICKDGEKLSLVATGKNAAYIVPFCKEIIKTEEDLTHAGNLLLYRSNIKPN
ncbi:MAG: type III pantothenate kinase [Clostridiales bacterium]|nr:type III pantothenate kinase [Clostridiales bacterium]